MDLRRLSYFVTVAEELSFSRAAIRLHIEQSPLSHQIRKLENELSVRLFDRTTRTVALTPAGIELYGHAVRILEGVAAAEIATRNVSEGRHGALAISVIDVKKTYVHDLLSNYTTRFRDVALTVHTDIRDSQVAEMLRTHRLDVGMIGPTHERDLVVQQIPDGDGGVLLGVPTSHSLAGADSVSLAQLREEIFIGYSSHTMPLMHAFVERSCHDAGFQPRVRQVATGLRTHLFLAGAGAGVAIVPRQGVTGETRSDVALVPIRDVELRIPAALAYAPGNRNRLIDGFMKAAEDIN